MKRTFDFIAALVGLIFLGPLIVLFSIIIKLEDGGSIFYRGERIGLNGRVFRIYKFRSMVINAEQIGASSTSDDDPRITKFGRSLRKYKLDELPQLINVLTGDMSLVGPRPQVKWAVDLYSSAEREILKVRPGITDDASLMFSNEGEILRGSRNPDLDYMEKIHPIKISLEMDYVKNHSLSGDIRIILRTLNTIFKKPEAERRNEEIPNPYRAGSGKEH